MNGASMDQLLQQLQHIGFPPEMEYNLRFYALFGQEQFQITWQQAKEGNSFKIVIHFNKEANEYRFVYYDAILRRMEELPQVMILDKEIKALDEKMQSIKWEAFQFQTVNENPDDIGILLNSVQGIVEALKSLEAKEEGKFIASRLKLKYWSDTPLEVFMNGLSSLKAGMEISQRYYVFEEGAQITLDEAYRFLCHRWKEKQLKSAKKQAGSIDPAVRNDKNSKKVAKGRKSKSERQENK